MIYNIVLYYTNILLLQENTDVTERERREFVCLWYKWR